MNTMDVQLIEAFRSISDKVKTEDVMETALEMPCHYATVQRYLAGKVKKEKFGWKMLEVLKGKLAKREEAAKRQNNTHNYVLFSFCERLRAVGSTSEHAVTKKN